VETARAPPKKFHADYVVRLALGRYRTADNSLPTKHVVAAGLFARDAGSTPAASTTWPNVVAFSAQIRTNPHNRPMSLPKDWPHLVRNGNTSIPIYHSRTKRGYDEFKVVWKFEGRRQFKTFSDFDDARRHASTVNASINSGDIKTTVLKDKAGTLPGCPGFD
jgi:hypothetical protein